MENNTKEWYIGIMKEDNLQKTKIAQKVILIIRIIIQIAKSD